MNERKILPNLPNSKDNRSDFWDGAETYSNRPSAIGICKDHTKNDWFKHKDYESDNNGGIICTKCPWGAKLPGYMRFLDGKIVDLRNPSSQ